ncbi:MAG TPA: DUF697 domain-containing protein [Saprospiraceae bacterium]|jgi:uncharacterized protein (DUF697 family)|nr:DUF697 domain-containing protein [Saprospiraceae bacterium]HMS30052.1 DUF697 domain-containing protein [Saprospiraceae bacterium]
MDNESNSYKADQIIRNHMLWSMGAGLIWVPIVDFLAVSAIQLDMVRQLAALYGKDFKEAQGKAIISALGSSGVSRIAARAVKFIPGVGTILGGITMSTMSGASTFAIGELFKKHFESGGTVLDFDPEAIKSKYNDLFEKGKEYASQLKKQPAPSPDPSAQAKSDQAEPDQPSSSRSMIDQLKDIAELKEKGLLSEEEYQDFKRKILGK